VSVAMVWDPIDNIIIQEPVESSNAAYQAWLATKNDISADLFLAAAVCGTSGLSNREPTMPSIIDGQASGCPLLLPGQTDSMTSTSSTKFLFTSGDGLDRYEETTVTECVVQAIKKAEIDPSVNYPLSMYMIVAFPDSPACVVGIRTQRNYNRTFRDTWIYLTEDAYNHTWIADEDWVDTFYGPFGEIGSHTGYRNSQTPADGYDILYDDACFIPQWVYLSYSFEHDYNVGDLMTSGIGNYDLSTDFKRHPQWTAQDEYVVQHLWNQYHSAGAYSHTIVASVFLVQYIPCTLSMRYDEFSSENNYKTLTMGNRVVHVQAQALFKRAGIANYDWIAEGKTAAFEAQIAALIDLAYSLNGIPAAEIRTLTIAIDIVA
jgi:hypothetical protein